jgi:hypothetical protein
MNNKNRNKRPFHSQRQNTYWNNNNRDFFNLDLRRLNSLLRDTPEQIILNLTDSKSGLRAFLNDKYYSNETIESI